MSASRRPVYRWLGALAALLLVLAAAVWRHSHSVTLETVQPVVALPVMARTQLELRNELLYRPGAATSYTGWVTESHTNGVLKLRTAVIAGHWDGVSEGWTPNGALVLRESFQRGLPNGPRVTWHDNGRKKSEGQLAAGKQQGEYRQWNEQGVLVAEAQFRDGQPDGLSRAWYASGYLQAEALMKAGAVQERHFYSDGERREAALLAGGVGPNP